jgi:hypothetical protein
MHRKTATDPASEGQKQEVQFTPGNLKMCLDVAVQTLSAIPGRYYLSDVDKKLRVRTREGAYTLATREMLLGDLDERLVFLNRKSEPIMPPTTIIAAILKYGQATGGPGAFQPLP